MTFAKNEYYTVNVKMRESDLARPLTFEAKAAGAVVSFSSLMETSPTIEFSKNGGAWTTYTEPITLTNVGDKVSFRGTNETYAQSTSQDSQFSRTTTSGVRYAKARVNGVTGVILLPDNWNASYYTLNNTNTADAAFISNIITLYDWVNSLEPHGAVFLPAAGYREGTNVQNVNAGGGYWSSDYSSSDGAYCVSFHSGAVDTKYDSSRFYGGLVRLVKKQ